MGYSYWFIQQTQNPEEDLHQIPFFFCILTEHHTYSKYMQKMYHQFGLKLNDTT